MSRQEGHEAIRVVIEKLTELVKESKEDGNEEEVIQNVEEVQDTSFAIMETSEGESQSDTVQTTEAICEQTNTNQAEIAMSDNPDTSSTVEITVNVPADLKKSLNTSDPRALLAALMSMDSNQVVVTQSPPEPVIDYAPVHMVENVGAEFVVMATEPAHSVEVQENVENELTATSTENVATTEVLSESEQPTRSKVKGSTAKAVDKEGQKTEKKVMLKCSKCDYCSHNKHYLKQHVDLVHTADRPFQCPFCDYAGKRSHSLKEHLVVHSTNRPFICSVCNASFRKKGHLTNHVKLHNTLKYLECAICHEKHTNKSQFYAHIRTAHNPNDVYECYVCDYTTVVKSNIIMHMHTHGNPEVYRCSVCSFAAVHINILRQHMQTHSEGQANFYKVETNTGTARPVILLKCSSCGYTTDNRDTLKNHMWTHMSKESFSEGIPPEESLVKNDDTVEQKAESIEQSSLYKCSECNYSCKQACLFITHLLAHHPRQKLIADHQKQQRQAPDANHQQEMKKESIPAFTHDSTAGMYRCTICGYMCEQQRTIKAHIWKHSGHKDIDYPMFQNGPISVYDDTPVGKSVLVTAEKSKPPIKIIVPVPDPEDQNVTAGTEANESDVRSRENQLSSKILPCKSLTSASAADSKDNDNLLEKGQTIVTGVPDQQSPPIIQNSTVSFVGGKIPAAAFTPSPVKWIVHPGSRTIKPVIPVSANQSQAVSTAKPITPAQCQQSQSSAFPAIVQLIMSPQVKTEMPPGDQSDINPGKTGKRKSSTDQEEREENIQGIAKRICLEDNPVDAAPTSNGNVVVQHVSQVYSTPTITIACNPAAGTNHDRMEYASTSALPLVRLAPSQHEGTDGISSAKTDVTHDRVEGSAPAKAGEEQSEETSMEEVALVETADVGNNLQDQNTVRTEDGNGEILRSLLKKGPDPTCLRTDDKRVQESENSSPIKADNASSDNESENPHSAEDNKKKGICSSLLAVIEQLREKSKSESFTENNTNEKSGSKEALSGAKSTRRRGRRSSIEDEMPIEQYPNVEKIEKNQHRCKLCHYTSTSPSLIKTHMRLHKTFEPFECSLCDFHATSSEGLQDHMLQHCKVRVYHCKVCTAEFNYKSQLRAHMRAHYEVDPFVCDVCDYETTNPISFRNHTWGHKKKKVENVQSDTGDSSDSSASQIVRTYNNQDLWCDQCIYVGKTSEDLIDHLKVLHRKVYKCELCSQQFYSSVFLKDHMKFHDREKQKVRVELKKCELCDFTAISIRSLKSHMKRHINDQRFVQQPLEQYKCNLCGYVCHHLPSLKSHMWRHASNQNYSYQEINDLINAAIDYDSNSRVLKTGEEQIELDNTEKVAEISNDLDPPLPENANGENSPVPDSVQDTVSISKRASLVTFRCCQCGFESAEKSMLNEHMKTHLDIIRKTLAVNKSQFVARAVKEMAQVVEKENENRHVNLKEVNLQNMAAKISKQTDD